MSRNYQGLFCFCFLFRVVALSGEMSFFLPTGVLFSHYQIGQFI